MLRFAIVGSAESERNKPEHPHPFSPPVDVDKANLAAAALGAALARKRHGLIVYDANFIEAVVVSAYVAASAPLTERGAPIVVRQPSSATTHFAEERTHPALFDRVADSSGQWEVSFFRSLADADGLILIGGAMSTLIAGQVAIGAHIPVLALLRSGGAAETVWRTIAPGVDLPTGNEHARMADEPSEEVANRWVDVLEGQRRRRHAVETGPIVWHAVVASVLFMLALAAAFGSHLGADLLASPASKALLFGSTLLAGVAGAAVRMVFERRYGSGPLVPPSMAITVALGLMAGALAGMLYIVAQPGDFEISAGTAGLRLVSLVLAVATIGGLTAEAIFRKLLGIDVLTTGGLAAPSDRDKP
ncbi:hypothetical protein QTI24_24515 [Variovorax sp. J22P240]|uniref:hypothetical protein n=1 Tax=Variovorax sp. J22P240 TaxID=3053514 RepID=UPI002574D177|nr:hypothetical protein [Variovorax sp. J22P240]MDM0001794.1 hypothetical protein [Variovorax sp. J22P240]